MRQSSRYLKDATVQKFTEQRSPYIEVREYNYVEQAERKAVRNRIGREVRDKCRSEYDEFFDCLTNSFLNLHFFCKKENDDVNKCQQKYRYHEFAREREAQLNRDREASGESQLKRKERAKYNRFVPDKGPNQKGWLPRSNNSATQRSDREQGDELIGSS